MRNNQVSQEEDRLMQQKLQEAFGYTDEQLAAQLDQAAAEYAAHPELQRTPPEGEFQKILEMAAQKENAAEEKSRKVIRLRRMVKPAILVATVGVIVLGTGMMASGRRYYEFWVRDAGNGQIIFNNTETLVRVDSLEQAYITIEKQLGIEAIRLQYVPEGIEFSGLVIEQGIACIDLKYKGNYLYFHQTTKDSANSTGYNSDREAYKVIYNHFLKKDINIYKNDLADGSTEFNAYWVDGNSFYCLDGTIEEAVFDKIIKNLSGYIK